MQDAINHFVTDSDVRRTVRTKTEIIYNSDGTKIQTTDAEGNRLQRYDSMSADPPALNNICSLVQDLHIPLTE